MLYMEINDEYTESGIATSKNLTRNLYKELDLILYGRKTILGPLDLL